MPDNLQLPVDWLVAPAGSAKSADADVSLADTRIDAAPADIGYAALAALLLQLSRYGNTNPSTLAFVERAGDTTQAMVSIDCTAASASSARQLLAVMRESLQQPTPADRVTDTRASIHITHAGSHDQALRLAHESVARGATQLRFVVSYHSGSLRATLVYDAGAFSAATAQRLASHFGALWQGLLSQPEAIAQNLQMLDAAEQDFIRDAGTAPEPATAHPDALALVDAAMARSPDGLAAIHNERRVTYSELGRLADGVGLRLRAAGVSAGDRVAVCLDPCVESLACILALLRLRAVYVPIDPGYPAARVSLMLQDCAARVIITSSRRQDSLREQAASLLVIDAAAVSTAPAEPAPTGTPSAEDGAYIFYTSGTTGAPKGVLANRGNLAHYVGVARARYDLTASDVMVCIARASFSISLFELLTPLTVGGTCVILDREQVLDFSRLAHALQHVSVIHAGPSLLRGLIAHVDASAPGTYDYSRMRHASSGGDLVPPEVLEGLRRIFRKAEIFVIYGCSEISVMGCTYEAPRQGQIDRTYVGAPFPGVRYRVLDEQRRPVPLGVSGEVYFSGPGVIAGYLNRAELTAERFCQIDGRRFYNTGDVGRICANGQLQLLGRLDFQVQIRGMRVELGEIEHALRRMPELRDAVVSARPDRSGEMALVAYYVPRDGIQITTALLRKALQAVLPDYMVPGIYCALDALPLNANMKVDRKALPDPATVRRASDADAQAPQLTATEETIAAIWRELLGIDVVRPQDDFFDIGGHSLTAMRVMTQLQSRAGVNLPASAIFQHGTLSALAQTVETQLATGGNRGEALQAFSRKAGELLPLSAAQERMWFWSEMAPDVALYNVPIMVKIEGALDEQRLQVALDAVMRRHEILRSRWRITDGTPQQVVDAQACWPLRIARSSGASTTAARDEYLALAEAESLSPINPARELPVRALLIHAGDTRHVLALTLHHSVCDGWSTEILLRDLWEAYEGVAAKAPALPIQYLDYALWERRQLEGGLRSADLQYWRGKLDGAPGSIDLPLDRPRAQVARYRGALHDVFFSTDEVTAIRALAQRSGTTLFMVLLAAWQTLLYRLSRQSTVVTGSVIANRSRNEIDQLVGYFANSVALRADFDAQLSVAGLLAQARRNALEAYDHQFTPFEEVVESLKLPREAGRMPLVQTFLELQPPTGDLPAVSGLLLERQFHGTPVAKFDLSLELQESSTGLQGFFEYDRDLFDGDTIARWNSYLHVLLAAMCRDDTQLIDALPLLPESERLSHLVAWNATARPYDNHIPVYRKFEQRVAMAPQSVAVWCDGQTLDYQELNRRSNRLARWLVDHGVGRDAPVGVFMERAFELVVAIVAIHKAGGVYVPVDPELPAERLQFMLDECRFPVLLTQRHLADRLPPSAAAVVLDVDAGWPAVSRHADDNLDHDASPEDLAYIIYTSGSTGRPKGVEIPHVGLTNHISWMEETLAFTHRDRFLQKTTISFDASVADFMLPLQAGASIILAKPGGHRDLAYLAQVIREQQVTATQFVPSALRFLVEEPAFTQCTSLRTLIIGGEALDWDTARAIYRLLPNVELGNFYGPSENSDDSTHFVIRRGSLDTGTVPIGRPIANVQCYVLDAAGQLAPIGVPGELHIGGVQLARGYRNRADLTAEKFVQAPALGGIRVYRSGDVVRRRANGLIEFLGRTDHQVKIRGFRIELEEIEIAVRALASPRHCAVVARKSRAGEPTIVAYLVGSALAHDQIRERLAARLPEYMVPAAFVDLEALPTLTNGKLDRSRLPDPVETHTARVTQAPRSPSEELVCNTYRTALGRDDIGVADNFFDLGGHSLMAGRIMARLRDQTGLDLPLRLLFEHPSIEGLARALDASRWAQTSGPAVAGEREEIEL